MRIVVWVALCAMGCGEPSLLSCGDAIVDPGERCDDGNDVAGDGCSACGRDSPPAFADEIVEAPGASSGRFGDPSRAINGVRGGGERTQSLDVYEVPPDAYLVLGFSGQRLLDGPGDDLVVFENAFVYGEDSTFVDPLIVEVSADGTSWVPIAHDYVADDETMYSSDRADWIGFGGVTPVYLHADTNVIDPFSVEAGGDRFDLASCGDERILREGARYVRLVPAPARTNPDTGQPFLQHPIGDGPDIDGVFARWLAEAL